ncbi:MAG: hypothetical protein ED555_11380 [Allomuricauda sp.]|nr:MAG: hypothetical protein ED555_11380 [Allomuricauda sp.]
MNSLAKIIIGLAVKAIVLFLLLNTSSLEAQRRSTSVNVNSNGKTTISIKNGFGNNFSIEYKGDITLTDDDSDVASISRGGYMEIKKSAFGNRRRILIEPNNSGGLIKKYWVGGSQQNFDSEGKKWLSEILLEVVRTTTLGSEQRVDRMYKKGGYYPVLKEVDMIESDYVKTRYLKLLLDKKMDEKGLIGTLKRVGQISSDHHQADILKHNSKVFLATDALRTTYIQTTGKINSDHHKASVLKQLVTNEDISDNQLKTLFTIAKDINSDHHQASVLLEVMKSRALNPENVKLLIATAKSINSDHHRASVLKKALNNDGLSSDAYHALLASTNDMSSDHHIASVLNDVLKEKLDQASLSHLLKQVEENMNSDMHQATVLSKIAKEQEVEDALDAFLAALGEVNSDHHKATVFKQLARMSFSDKELIQILEATTTINSDFHQAESLLSFAPKVKSSSDAVRDAYMDATEEISSDSHVGRVLKALR